MRQKPVLLQLEKQRNKRSKFSENKIQVPLNFKKVIWPQSYRQHKHRYKGIFITVFIILNDKNMKTQFSHSVMSNSLWPHELQHARPPCPSPTPGVHPNPCPLSQWCHPTISSSVIPFSSCPQSFPVSGSFQMSQLFTSGSQSISFNISPSHEYPGLISFKMDWLDLLAV